MRETLYTKEEVDELIPTLDEICRNIVAQKRIVTAILKSVRKAGGSMEGTRIICPSLGREEKIFQNQVDSAMSDIHALIEDLLNEGMMVDDLELLAFDFESEQDGDDIYLCWQFGEKEVEYWHYTDEHFKDRKPLHAAVNSVLDAWELIQ